jgi:hypothetical protein
MRMKTTVLLSLLYIIIISTSPWLSPTGSVAAMDIPNWPTETARMLFIHHSCGENLWYTYGDLSGELADINIEPHDATYGDTIGDDTDVCHWYPKFRDQLDEILTFNHSSDVYYPLASGVVNDIIMFKSCYPASDIWGWGTEPGNPEDSDQTIANYKAAYNALLPIFQAHPDTLFIPMTAPPLNRGGGWTPENGANASYFNYWLADEWAPDVQNIAVFDWFHFLADPNDFAALGDYVDGTDSHPNQKACENTTAVFIEWIDDVIVRWQTGIGTTTLPTTTETPSIPGFPLAAIFMAIPLALGVSLVKRRHFAQRKE